MTELEIMQRAKMYIDKLANGVNPLDDQPVHDADVVNQVRISRCLFYVSSVLQQVIQNGGVVGKAVKPKKVPFCLDTASRNQFEFSTAPIPVSEITRRINQLINPEAMMQLKYTSITEWLIGAGFLAQETSFDGKTKKRPTSAGNQLGIQVERRTSMDRVYDVIVYSAQAQQFLLDNLDGIIALNNQPAKKEKEHAPTQEKPLPQNVSGPGEPDE